MALSRKMMRALEPKTPAEHLWTQRRAAGLGIHAAARALGMGHTTYWRCERGEHPIPALRGPLARAKPGLHVLLALARRRSGLGLAGVAAALKVSRVTVLKWERETDPRIIEFWSKKMVA